MKTIAAGVLLGLFFFFSGGANWFFNIPMKSHDLCLLGVGIVMLALAIPALVVAGIRYLRKRSQQSHMQSIESQL